MTWFHFPDDLLWLIETNDVSEACQGCVDIRRDMHQHQFINWGLLPWIIKQPGLNKKLLKWGVYITHIYVFVYSAGLPSHHNEWKLI